MTTLSARDEYSVAIAAGEKLTITSSVSSTGYVDRWRGSTNLGRTVITASKTLVFGPYLFGMRFNVVCQTGSISFSSADENSAINDAEFIEFKQDSPLAQSIPLADDLGLFTHPFRFGAVGDGVTDDKLALQSCINYAKSVGAEVNLYGLTYGTTGTIYLNSTNAPAKGIHLHDGKIVVIGGEWTDTEFSTVFHIKSLTDGLNGRKHYFDRIDVDCGGLAHYGWVFNNSGKVNVNFCTAKRYNGAGFYLKAEGDGLNASRFISCSANEADFNEEPKASTYSARTGVGFLLDSVADVTFIDCVASVNKYNIHLTGEMWNGQFLGGRFWSGPTRTDPDCVCVRIDSGVNRMQFVGVRFDDGAVKMYGFNHRFIGCEFIQYALGQLQLVSTVAGETAKNLALIGNTFSDITTPVDLLVEGSGTWGTVACEWSNNRDLSGAPVEIQNKSLITAGLTIESGNVNLSGELQIDGVKVLGNRITGYGDFTNGAKTGFDATTATLPEVAAAVAQLITDFKTQGSIGA
jgi:hypothetical protein